MQQTVPQSALFLSESLERPLVGSPHSSTPHIDLRRGGGGVLWRGDMGGGGGCLMNGGLLTLPLGFGAVAMLANCSGLSGKLKTWISLISITTSLENNTKMLLYSVYIVLNNHTLTVNATYKQGRHYMRVLLVSPHSHGHHSTGETKLIHKFPLLIVPDHHYERQY